MAKLQVIDDSNRSAHHYLSTGDECYFLHEYTAREGALHSPENQFIFNFKKPTLRRERVDYPYKAQAIAEAIAIFRELFDTEPHLYEQCTFVPIPPSKPPGHEEYDDRMWQLVQGLCQGKNADARELILQTEAYAAAHLQGSSPDRIKPPQLRDIYRLNGLPPKAKILFFDDVLSAGTHFTAAKSKIQAAYPETTVIGFFQARRVFPAASVMASAALKTGNSTPSI